ncbi:MAG: MBL fold metallo-hydrolase [Bacteroidaceae bacterium]|nr:MBL fold metallo-hydrolase [Bacteroidaceae bacterium]
MIKRFPCNMFEENCYVLSDDSTKECVIIDCGALYESEADSIINYIKNEGLKPVHLLCTHGHLDHNFGNGAIYDAFGLKAKVHFEDEKMLKEINKQTKQFFQVEYQCNTAPIGKLLTSGETINYGSQTLEVLPTPGHSRGSVTFYNRSQEVAFTGDTLFRMSIGRTDLEGGDYETILSSLHLLATTLPPETKIYPGHGTISTIAEELDYNPYLK